VLQPTTVYIGTSGWNYNHWRGPFYPKELPQKQWLAYYCERFSTVEINNSFYQLPSKSTLETWRKTVPASFTFSVKASRYITHMKKLKDPSDALTKFYNGIEILGERLGPILFQLPPGWHVNVERLESFLSMLSSDYRHTFEFRDESWFCDSVYDALEKYSAAFCIYHLEGRESPRKTTSDFVYLRLHGPDGAYEGSYDGRTLAGWSRMFTRWRKGRRDVYCYFDNDQNGYAAHDALKLLEIANG
jgi:uncharacterized protein YecE (DUF72 family)